MDINQFVSALGLVVEESAIKGVVENLKDPPGRAPSQEMLEMSRYYLSKAASNGMFLPGNKDKVKEMGLLGHWSNHKKYTNEIDKDLDVLNKLFKRGELSDMDVLLGLGGIQCQARAKFIKTLPALNQLFFESVVDHPSINNDGFPVDKRHYSHTFEELNQLIKSIKFTGIQYSKV